MKRRLQSFTLVLLLIALGGCGAHQLQDYTPPAPASYDQALALLEEEYAAVKRTAADALNDGLMSPARAEWFNLKFIEGNKILEAARLAWDLGNPQASEEQSNRLRELLRTVRAELVKRGGD